MPKAETTPARAPRGAKPVAQAFFAALDAVPEAARAAVARAAQAMIRDEARSRREKAKAAAARAKARKPAAAKPAAKAAAAKPSVRSASARPAAKEAAQQASEAAAVPAKRRARKQDAGPAA